MSSGQIGISANLTKSLQSIVNPDPEAQMQMRMIFANNHVERVEFLAKLNKKIKEGEVDKKDYSKFVVKYDEKFANKSLYH